MNKIEQMFYDAWNDYYSEPDDCKLQPGKVIGPYQADFYCYTDFCHFVVEIDGHEAHKTKEQRDYDYKRERYFQKMGITVVRFTGTEIFLDSEKCVIELGEIISNEAADTLELMFCQRHCFEAGIIPREFVIRRQIE